MNKIIKITGFVYDLRLKLKSYSLIAKIMSLKCAFWVEKKRSSPQLFLSLRAIYRPKLARKTLPPVEELSMHPSIINTWLALLVPVQSYSCMNHFNSKYYRHLPHSSWLLIQFEWASACHLFSQHTNPKEWGIKECRKNWMNRPSRPVNGRVFRWEPTGWWACRNQRWLENCLTFCH